MEVPIKQGPKRIDFKMHEPHIFLALAGLVDLIQGSNHFFLILSNTLYGFRNKFNGLAKYYYFLRWSRFLEFSILIHNKTKFNV